MAMSNFTDKDVSLDFLSEDEMTALGIARIGDASDTGTNDRTSGLMRLLNAAEQTKAPRGTEDAVSAIRIGGIEYQLNGGIVDPKPVLLSAGKILVRFGNFDFGMDVPFETSKRMDGPNWSEGCWWIDASGFKMLREHALAHGCSLSQAVSDLCMLPPAWSNRAMYGFFKVTASIMALSGRGRAAVGKDEHGNQVRKDPNPDLRIEQIYIPFDRLGNLTCIAQFSSVASARSLRKK